MCHTYDDSRTSQASKAESLTQQLACDGSRCTLNDSALKIEYIDGQLYSVLCWHPFDLSQMCTQANHLIYTPDINHEILAKIQLILRKSVLHQPRLLVFSPHSRSHRPFNPRILHVQRFAARLADRTSAEHILTSRATDGFHCRRCYDPLSANSDRHSLEVPCHFHH